MHARSLCRVLSVILFLGGWFPQAHAWQAVPPAQVVPQVRLEAHEGKTQFRLGEVITLDLVIPAPTGCACSVNTTDYGDLADDVEITPESGWIRWQGRSGHDYLVSRPLQVPEVRIPLTLNQGFVFRKPGEYEIRVTTNRLLSGGSAGGGFGPLTTNQLRIELLPMPAEDEAALVRSLQSEIANAPADPRGLPSPRFVAAEQLAALGSDDALKAKLALMLAEDGDMRRLLYEAMASTRNLPLQLKRLEQAWADPTRSPSFDVLSAMQETRTLLRGDTLPGWVMLMAAPDPHSEAVQAAARQHRADMDVLIRSLPARSGQNRSDALYLLMEDHGLTPVQQAAVAPLAIDDFPHMSTLAQHMLLETAEPSIHDAHLVPALRSMLDRDPEDKDALKDLIRFDPDAAKPYLIRAICDRRRTVPLDAVSAFPAATLPEVDTCLTELLRGPAEARPSYLWTAWAQLAARFASAAVLPALRDAAGSTSAQQAGPVLALLLRYEPAEATERLRALDWRQANPFFDINRIFDARKAAFPPELTSLLRQVVRTGSPDDAGTAGYELSRYGVPADRALLEARLQQVRSQWHGHEAEVAHAEWQTEAGKAKQLDMSLMSDLRNASLWTETDAEASQLAQGCLSDACRVYGEPRPAVPPRAHQP